ncbi:MAG: hypothetical protein OEY68_08360 [Gammaproteobacteria bacterium]|nr:hypothetical protein [Gammaproteobacteria bacterium]
MKVLRSISLAVFAIVLSNSFISQASATPITTSFETTVQSTSGIPGVNVGDNFSASFTFDNDETAASSVLSPICGFGGCFKTYRFTDPVYTGNVSTPSLNYSSDGGIAVGVFNDFTMPSGLFGSSYELGILGNPDIYDFIMIGGGWGSIGENIDLSGNTTNISEIGFSLLFIGNSNLISDTSLPLSIDELLSDPDFIGSALLLSLYELQQASSFCSGTNSCLGGGGVPVEIAHIYGEEVSAIPTPATLLLIAPGLLALVKLSKRNN